MKSPFFLLATGLSLWLSLSGCGRGLCVNECNVLAAPYFDDAAIGAFGDGLQFSVSGTSVVGTSVQLYSGRTCVGTPVQTLTAAEFAAGVVMEVGSGETRKVISARAYNGVGLVSSCTATAATYTPIRWTWRSGDTVGPGTSSFGTLGVAAASNIPTARSGPAIWFAQNKIMMFGGNALGFGNANDLWSFDLTTSWWTWESGSNLTGAASGESYGTMGVEAPGNLPPARAAGGYFSLDNGLWFHGGYKYSGSSLSEVWRFDLGTRQWTWVRGDSTGNAQGAFGTIGLESPSNDPPNRFNSFIWGSIDGNYWTYGGNTRSLVGVSSLAADLWRFSATTRMWTWVSGSNLTDQNAVYGTQGVASASNNPGSRYVGCAWADSSKRLWLFGGVGYGESGGSGYLNDLWRFDPATSLWTFVAGSRSIDNAGVFGTQQVPDSNNVPGARRAAACWIDSRDRLWLFGGFGLDEAAATGRLADMWYFTPSTGKWTWYRGSKTRDSTGIYGTLGTVDVANIPGARQDAGTVVDSNGRAWFFGGAGFGASGGSSFLNDLWSTEVP
jgi:hypothetical protein